MGGVSLRCRSVQEHLQAIVTVLSLINPGVCAVIFAREELGRTDAERRGDATRASLAVFVILERVEVRDKQRVAF